MVPKFSCATTGAHVTFFGRPFGYHADRNDQLTEAPKRRLGFAVTFMAFLAYIYFAALFVEFHFRFATQKCMFGVEKYGSSTIVRKTPQDIPGAPLPYIINFRGEGGWRTHLLLALVI